MLPTTTGTGITRTKCSNLSPVGLREMWRADVTVDWTTKMSTPASTASGANRLVLAGVQETAQTAPRDLTSRTRFPMRSGRMGSE